MKNKKKNKYLNKGRAIGLRQAALLIDPDTSNLARWEAVDKLREMADDIEKDIHNKNFYDDSSSIIDNVIIEAAIAECIDLLTSNGLYAVRSKTDANVIIGGPSKQKDKLLSGAEFDVYENSFMVEVIKDCLGIKLVTSIPGIGITQSRFHRSVFEAVQSICEPYRQKGFIPNKYFNLAIDI